MVSVESLEHVGQRRWWLDFKVWAPSKIKIFHGAQIDTVLIWGRKNAMEPKFWWGVLCMRRTGRRLLQVGNSRSKEDGVCRKLGTCGPKKMVARLKSLGPIENYNFPWSMGLKTIQCWFEVERTLWSLNSGEASGACEQHVGGCCKSENIRTKQDGASRKFGTCGPKKIVTL